MKRPSIGQQAHASLILADLLFVASLLVVAIVPFGSKALAASTSATLSAANEALPKKGAVDLNTPISLGEAVQLAVENQPRLSALGNAAAAAREAGVAGAQLPDPKLKLGVINLPVTTRDAGYFDRDGMTMASVGYAQQMIPKAKRDAKAQVFEAEAEQYQAEQQVLARTIQRDVALAWLDVFEAQQRVALYQRLIDNMQVERKVAVSQLSTGKTQATDSLTLDRKVSMMRDQRLMAQRDERKARVALSRWLGAEAQRPLPANLPDVIASAGMVNAASVTTEALLHHPEITSVQQQEEVARAELASARSERLQNWDWEVSYGKRFRDLSDMVTVQVAIDLQPDRANRQDRLSSEKILLADQARQLKEDKQRELMAAMANAKEDLFTAQAREQEHESQLIPAAQARLKLIEVGYASGKQALADVWEARRSVLEIELDHAKVMADTQRAAVNLAYYVNETPNWLGNAP